MELLIVILLLIIGLLTFLLLKKERILGIKPETTNKNTEVKIVENKEYRKNIFDKNFLYSNYFNRSNWD